jgi:hypothetical protein
MTSAEFGRLKTGVAIYCSACGQPHLIERRRLWLGAASAKNIDGPTPLP